MKVSAKSPMTSTVQMEANASSGVSSLACWLLISVSVCSMVMGTNLLMNDAKRAAPACKVHDAIERALLVSESIIRQRVVIGSRRLVQREVNDEGQTHDIGARNKTPVPAVAAVVAVVAEHEI